jgi:hypothetical protein
MIASRQALSFSFILFSLFVGPRGVSATTPEEEVSAPKTETAHSDVPFLQSGAWWNLFFSKGQDPLRGRSVRAVKVLRVAEQHPSWIRIAFPKDAKEHRSIYGPAAKAHKRNDIRAEDALDEWEKTVTAWQITWINLNFVVHASRVAETNDRLPGRSATSADDSPFSDPTLPQGVWRVELPAGFSRPVTIESAGDDRFSLSSKASVFNGTYHWKSAQLTMVEPHDPRMQGLVWSWNGHCLTLIQEPAGTPTGSSYLGTKMTRVARPGEEDSFFAFPRE